MELGWGLLAPRTGARADVLVRVDAGTLFGEVAAELRRHVLPVDGTGLWSVGGVGVDPDCPVGTGPLRHGALLQLDAAARPEVAAVHEAHVVGGPQAGRVLRLTPGQLVLGRDGAEALADPQVSRSHCRLEVSAAGVVVHDLGSTNGTELDGAPVPTTGAAWVTAAVLRIGDMRLVLAPPAPRPVPVTARADGRVAVNRPPRLRPDPQVARVVFPHPPAERERGAVPVLAMVLPLLLGVVVWRITGNALFLLFTLLSPVMVIGSVVTERRSGSRRSRREQRLFAEQHEAAETMLRDAVRADTLTRRDQWPDAAALSRTATGPDHRLWERRRADDDVLDLRLGLADLPARVEVEGVPPGAQTTDPDVPLVVPLADVGVLGVSGPGAQALARWLVVQSAVLHSPRDLSVVVLGPTARWAWARWLPHVVPGRQDCQALFGSDEAQTTRRVAELVAELDVRRSERGPETRPQVLLIVDGARRTRAVPGLARLLAEGPAVGIVAVCVEDDPQLLPGECGATARVGSSSGCMVTLRRHGRPDQCGTADLVDDAYAETVARALSCLVDDGAAGDDGLPARVRWTELVGLELDAGPGDAARVAARWSETGRCTRALLGRGAQGPVAIDLVADGPHALVAGTTGSGKSELLQTLIASLALGHRPDELVFVLVDYKGGAAFGPCEHLPHVVGLVTDLDAGLVERALASLRAELARREAVLRDAGVKDLDDYRRRAGAGEALPRLVLVVDEFASLAEELPGFVGGLVDIAMRGRSLGVHLVLATQRPEGVVSADIRANTNLRICLAVTRENESRDVVDSPLAATISRATPGRAWLRTGHTELTAVQSARVGGRHQAPRARRPGPAVELQPACELGRPRATTADTADDGDRTDLDLLVAACHGAAADLQISAGRSPWLPPLPDTLVLDGAGPARALQVGVLDVPAQQTRRPLELDLDTGTHLLVLGSARSGRTTVLRTLAGALATTLPPDDVHLYALDLGGGGLAALSCLPHTGAVVGTEEPARLARVLDWLAGQVAHRQQVLTAAGHVGLAEHRAAASPDERLPHLLLLVDRWEAFLAAYQEVDGGRLVDLVLRLLREGPAVGLHVVITADRSALVGRMASAMPQRLLLRMADAADYAAAGLAPRLVPQTLPAGRGWWLDAEPLVAQVALLDPDPSGPAQAAALHRLAALVVPATRPPHRIASLPDTVRLAGLPAAPSGRVALGVGGDGPDLVHLGLLAPGLIVGGPPGSGRSNALLTMAHGGHGLRTLALAPRPSPLRELPGCLPTQNPDALRDALHHGPALLLVDDAELLVDSPVGLLLEDVIRDGRDRGVVVVAAGTTSELAGGYRGFVVAMRRLRSGLLLSPESAADGDLLNVRLPRSTGGRLHPGRGLLVDRDRVQAVQVAMAMA